MYTIKFWLIFIFTTLSIFASDSSINGTLKFQETNLGGIQLNFIDSSNQVFSTETNIYGEFNIKLPNKKYRIEIGNHGYLLDKTDDIIYDFSNSSKPYFLAITAYEKPAKISGKILNENFEPFLNSKVTIKSSNITKTIYTNQFGNFDCEIPSGIFTITSEYEGFLSTTVIKKVPMASSISNIQIILKPKIYSVSGIITNGVRALPNINVTLYDEEGNLLSTSLSSENGYYEFQNLKSHSFVYILVDSNDYEQFKSKKFKITDNIKNNSIILKSK